MCRYLSPCLSHLPPFSPLLYHCPPCQPARFLTAVFLRYDGEFWKLKDGFWLRSCNYPPSVPSLTYTKKQRFHIKAPVFRWQSWSLGSLEQRQSLGKRRWNSCRMARECKSASTLLSVCVSGRLQAYVAVCVWQICRGNTGVTPDSLFGTASGYEGKRVASGSSLLAPSNKALSVWMMIHQLF